jgi:hypothetical protein
MLAQILALLQQVGRPVQAYGSFLMGPTTAGLTGNGTLSVTGAIGVLVSLTTLPSYIGSEAGSPNAIFDVGFITPRTPAGAFRSEAIRHNPQIFMLPSEATSVGYSLSPGVVASIQLLDGGP